MESSLALIITSGAASLAVATSLWAVNASLQAKRLRQQWHGLKRKLDSQVGRAGDLSAADPDALLIWDEGKGALLRGLLPTLEDGGVQAPDRLDGAGLDHLMPAAPAISDQDAETAGRGHKKARALVAGRFEALLANLDPATRARFAQSLTTLRDRGTAFTLLLKRLDGTLLEATGRPAGAQALVRLRDVSNERAEIERLNLRLSETAAEHEAVTGFLKQAPVPMWRRNRDLKLTWVNDAFAAAVDAPSPEDVLARHLEMDGGDRGLAADALDKGAIAQDRRVSIVGGTRKVLDFTDVPVADSVFGFAVDVSEAEDLKRESERQADAHRQTLDKLRTAVAIFGADKRLTFFNRAYAELWQLDGAWLKETPEDGEILDRLRTEGRLPEQNDFRAWRRARLELYTEVLVEQDELWHLPDGRTLRVLCRANPQGGLIYLYDDVSDQMTLERRYNALIGVQRATLDNLHEAVALFGTDGRLKLHNAAFAELWGLADAQLGEEPHFDRLTEHCAPLVETHNTWSHIAEGVLSLQRRMEPARLVRQDGRVLEATIEVLPDGRSLLSFLDVTAANQVEQALRERTEALEAADHLKSKFMATVSYHLRTPLQAVIGFAELLDSGLAGALSDKQAAYVGNIVQSANDLHDLIEDVLALSMIEAGTLTLDLAPMDVQGVLEAARLFAIDSAQDTAVRIDIECAEDVGEVLADERRVKQVLFNLLTNAVAYTPEGGRIRVAAKRDGAGVRLSVSDTGKGIPGAAQAGVFDRFESVGRGEDGGARGAGLGLALVKSFVELHGGWVSLESREGQGTTVSCYLPANPQVVGQAAE